MDDKDIKQIEKDLGMLEAHLQHCIEIATRLRKQLGSPANDPSSRKGKGLSDDQKAELLAKRKSRINKYKDKLK